MGIDFSQKLQFVTNKKYQHDSFNRTTRVACPCEWALTIFLSFETVIANAISCLIFLFVRDHITSTVFKLLLCIEPIISPLQLDLHILHLQRVDPNLPNPMSSSSLSSLSTFFSTFFSSVNKKIRLCRTWQEFFLR